MWVWQQVCGDAQSPHQEMTVKIMGKTLIDTQTMQSIKHYSEMPVFISDDTHSGRGVNWSKVIKVSHGKFDPFCLEFLIGPGNLS